MLALHALLACDGGGGTKTPTSPGDTGTTPTFTLSPDLELSDAENYAFDATWQIPSSQIASAPAEIFLDWATHTVDATGAPRAADSYPVLALFEATATGAELMDRLSIDDAEAAIANAWEADVAGDTEAEISDVGVDPRTLVEDATRSWLVALADRDGNRLDLRDAILVVPTAAQPGITLAIPDGLASYDWTARMNGNDTLRTDAGHAAYTLDWSALTTDAYGKPFDPARTDQLFVGRFDDVDEADDLGSDVLDLEAVASGFWTAPTGGGTRLTLADCADGGGAAFPGFTSDTSWLVGGRCTTCFGGAPTFLAVVEVREP